MLDRRQCCPNASGRLRLATPEGNATEPAKAAPPDCDPRCNTFEVAIQADKDSIVHLTHGRNQRVWRIWRELLAEQNHFVAALTQGVADGIRHAVINKEFNWLLPYAAELS
jgi:hypothetical protein